MPPSVRVVSASESAAHDRTAIENGIPSRALMQRAGIGAASEITRRYPERVRAGTVIYTGPGNNGGDGWVVASALSREGFRVRVKEVVPAKTDDAIAERSAALEALHGQEFEPQVVVDALLGTGNDGEPRGPIGDAVREINTLRRAGARVVALDVPSGLNASTGEHGSCVYADLTLSFGGAKRGTLLARDCSGEIVILDIGLDVASSPHEAVDAAAPSTRAQPQDATSRDDALPLLIDSVWVHSRIPPIHYNAHKGTRKNLAVIGGGPGMPGAVVLATRASLRSGIGLVRAVVHADNAPSLTAGAPSALVANWPSDAEGFASEIGEWADAIVFGPGLGKSKEALQLFRDVLTKSEQPVVIDADAINLIAENSAELAPLLGKRPALLTPHPAEFARLSNSDVKTVLANRFDIGCAVSKKLGATILLKGTPTIVFMATGARYVVARGTAALATGGSGDLLSGIAGTLLAQTTDPLESACCAAWIHGRAAELCGYVRGTTLEDVLYALPRAWSEPEPMPAPPVLATLPAVHA